MNHVTGGSSSKLTSLALVVDEVVLQNLPANSSEKAFWLDVGQDVIENGFAKSDGIGSRHCCAIHTLILSLKWRMSNAVMSIASSNG